MILYFPKPYPDEIVYSLLSRAYEYGGYFYSIQAKEEFFKDPKSKLNFLFINKLTPNLVKLLTMDCTWEEFLQDHTLGNYYGRYLPDDKRRETILSLSRMEGNYKHLFSLASVSDGDNEYLRYCPMCAMEQKEKYGEAYWNRTCQVPEITVCHIHGCKLLNSKINIVGSKKAIFRTAETELDDFSVNYGNEKEKALSEYVNKMICTPLNLEDSVNIQKFFLCKLEGTKYLQKSKQTISTSILFQDIKNYYSDFKIGITKEWQLSKIFVGKRTHPFEIAQVALFLGISADELIKMALPNKTPNERFNETVLESIKSGVSVSRLAKKYGVSKTAIYKIAWENGIIKQKQIKTSQTMSFEEKIEKYRKIWRDETSKYYGFSYSYMLQHSENSSCLNWLRRNDKEWTDLHFPKKINKPKQSRSTS